MKWTQYQRGPLNRSRLDNQRNWFSCFFEESWTVTAFLFLAFVLATTFICFWGQSPLGPPLLPNQIAQVRTVAQFNFSYESKEQTQRLRERLARQVPPVYRLDLVPYDEFEKALYALIKGLDSLQSKIESLPESKQLEEVVRMLADLEAKDNFLFNPEDCWLLLKKTDSETRRRLLLDGLLVLKDGFRDGILEVEPQQPGTENLPTGQLRLLNLYQESGGRNAVHFQSQEEVLRSLRINLYALSLNREIASVLFRILKLGIVPNLVYDADATEAQSKQLQDSVTPVRVKVEAGQTLTRPGTRVTPDQYEQLQAYRKQFRQNRSVHLRQNWTFLEPLFLALVVLASALLLARTSSNRLSKDNYRLALTMAVVCINLALMRLVLGLGDTRWGSSSATLIKLLPFLSPVLLGPLLITILLGARSAVITALILSAFNGLMQSMAIDVFWVSWISSLTVIILCREVRVRARVIRAAFFAGLVMGGCACILGVVRKLEAVILAQQALVCLLQGGFLGVVAVGLLPLLENLFRYTTEITLLELTDFNHPLLRRLQVEAPGTYHHSLMVANLAENAASLVGASSIICRVCALFHDVGKLVKPEYFIENQREGINPHVEQNPSLSVLVIKSHVKEGVELAQKYRLPKVVRDVIQQHHGTRLISYFYDKALRRCGSQGPQAPDGGNVQVPEAMYRYEGPKPQFKESAIVSLADSVEAASRSLSKITPQNVEELIDTIIKEHIQDDQFSDCPITFAELNHIKKSFLFGLLTMLHSRVEYPKREA